MIQVNRYTLANGLRIVHNEDDSTQMVALNLLYDVGARDEDPSHTGFAHLFEHLMFGGSLHIPDYDTPVQNAEERTMPGPTTTLQIITSPCRTRTWKRDSGWKATACSVWISARRVWRCSARW